MLFAVSLALVVSSVLGGAIPQQQQQTFQFQSSNTDSQRRQQFPTDQNFGQQQFGGQTFNGFQEDPWFEFVPLNNQQNQQDSRFSQFPIISVGQVSGFPPLSLQTFNPNNQQQTFNSQNTYSQFGTQQAQTQQFQFIPLRNQQQQQQQFGTQTYNGHHDNDNNFNNNFNNFNNFNNNQQQFGGQPFNAPFNTPTSFDIDTRCAQNNDMNADRTNCAGYFVCIEGRITQAHTCSSPLLYDAATKTCRHPQNVQCGYRPELPMPQAQIPQDATSTCYMPFINITIAALNAQNPNQNTFQQPMFVPRVPLYYILLMLNGQNNQMRFGMQNIQNSGMFVTDVNNLQTGLSGAWIPMDRFQNPINMGLDRFVPSDGDIVTFVYYPVTSRKVKDDKKEEEKVVE